MIKRFAVALCFALLAGPALADDGDAKKKAKKKTARPLPARLLGAWTYVSGKRAGDQVMKERLIGQVTFKKEEMTLPGGPDQMFVMGYKIDAKQKPATIDLVIKDGPVKEGKALGIIKLEKGQITLCYHPEGEARPTKFESTKDNGAFLFVLKRQRSIDIAKLVGKWGYVSGVRGGEEVAEERLAGVVTFTKDLVTIPAGPESKFVMAFKIAQKTPATIDLEIKEGPVPEGKALGLIKLEGDKLTLCYDPQGGARPKGFKSTAENGAFLFVLKRQK